MSPTRRTSTSRRTQTVNVPVKIRRNGSTVTKTVPMKVNTITRTTRITP
ncbi:hypothetical protein BKP42_53990 [Rhodococcus erythropolis]|nr:hypothetical protein [Rhodococcus erythropolis]PBI91047.1 hypothetical protein BKP42_53990 [Rhodococcus erythropolis]